MMWALHLLLWISLQDGEKVFRGRRCRDTGGGRYHPVDHCQEYQRDVAGVDLRQEEVPRAERLVGVRGDGVQP